MKKKNTKISIFLLLGALCVLVFLCGIFLGSVSLKDLFSKDGLASLIISLRLPRVLAAGLAGIGLSLSGLLLQTATGNALCAPHVLGVNAGAGLGVMLVCCYLPHALGLSPVAAFLGGMASSIAVILIASAGAGEISKVTLVLAGVAAGAFLNAIISFLMLRYPDAASTYSSFTIGGFRGVSLERLGLPFIIVLVCTVIAVFIAPSAQLLLLGEDLAYSLGVNVKRMRMLCVILASALAGSIVSYAGMLSFIGLAVPHISRLFLGQKLRPNIAGCIMTGFSLVIISDLLGRILFSPTEVPAGIVTSAIGAPFFVYLLIKRKRR